MNKLIVANLKMYMDYNTTIEYVNKVNKNIIVCPSYIYIPYFLDKVITGAQDCFQIDKGAYTGYVSACQLSSMGVKYSIIGHSERRNVEDDDIINTKIKSALNNNLNVILCIGETADENLKDKLEFQIKNDLRDIDLSNLIIAYEPIWAIGTGVTPTMEKIEESIKFIKDTVKAMFSTEIMVLYGGSVDVSNIEDLNKVQNVDGFLVGSASTHYEKINEIYELTN